MSGRTRLALVGEKKLPAAPNTPQDSDPDAISSDLHVTTDTSVTFAGHIAKFAFDKFGNLQVHLTIAPDSPVSNRDIAPLRSRLLAITLEPRRRATSGNGSGSLLPSDPTVDPVHDEVLTERVNRMIDRWVDGWDDDDLEPDWIDPDDVCL